MTTKKVTRSSVTGKFVNKSQAKTNPGTTQTEKVRSLKGLEKEVEQYLDKYFVNRMCSRNSKQLTKDWSKRIIARIMK